MKIIGQKLAWETCDEDAYPTCRYMRLFPVLRSSGSQDGDSQQSGGHEKTTRIEDGNPLRGRENRKVQVPSEGKAHADENRETGKWCMPNC